MQRIWDKSKFPSGPFTINKDCWQAQQLVNWYPLGGVSSRSYAQDLVSGKNATGTSSPIILPDGSPANTYNGISDRLLSNSPPSIYSSPLTVSAWAVPANTGAGGLSSFGDPTVGSINRFQFDITAGSLRWIAVGQGTNGTASVTGIVAGKLQHCLASQLSATSRTTYLNGKPGTTDTTNVTPAGTPSYLLIGAIQDNNLIQGFFTGSIGEVCIWSKAMSAAEAAYLADPGNRFELYYPLRSRKWFLKNPSSIATIYRNKGDSVSSTGSDVNPQHGVILLDFKNNNNEASITITNPAILSTSKADSYFIGYGSTTDHSVSDHRYAPLFIKLSCEAFNGSMTIHARSKQKMSGKFLIKYLWVN
jgi:hypothetical protein